MFSMSSLNRRGTYWSVVITWSLNVGNHGNSVAVLKKTRILGWKLINVTLQAKSQDYMTFNAVVYLLLEAQDWWDWLCACWSIIVTNRRDRVIMGHILGQNKQIPIRAPPSTNSLPLLFHQVPGGRGLSCQSLWQTGNRKVTFLLSFNCILGNHFMHVSQVKCFFCVLKFLFSLLNYHNHVQI